MIVEIWKDLSSSYLRQTNRTDMQELLIDVQKIEEYLSSIYRCNYLDRTMKIMISKL